jgi:hypothetical protein
MLPLATAAAIGGLLRDITSLPDGETLLDRWRPLDYLLVLHLLHGDGFRLRRRGQSMTTQVDDWMRAHPQDEPALFRWILGDHSSSRAEELLGSLGLTTLGSSMKPRDRAYTSLFRSVLMLERARGFDVTDLERRWSCQGFEDVEERWRDELLWLLAGWCELLDVRVFYGHLKSAGRSQAEIRAMRDIFRTMRRDAVVLRGDLRYCSALGPMLRDLRKRTDAPQKVGIGTARVLEGAGLTSVEQLTDLGEDGLVRLGIRRDLARQIDDYIRTRVGFTDLVT